MRTLLHPHRSLARAPKLRGAASWESAALLAAVAILGALGFPLLGDAMEEAIARDAAGTAVAARGEGGQRGGMHHGAPVYGPSAMAAEEDDEDRQSLDDVLGDEAEGDDYVGPLPPQVDVHGDGEVDLGGEAPGPGVANPDNGKPNFGDGGGRSFSVQVIAFGREKRAEAEAYAAALREERGFDAYVEEMENGLWAVRIGHLGSAEEAEAVLAEFSRDGGTRDAFIARADDGRGNVIERPDGTVPDRELIPDPVFGRGEGSVKRPWWKALGAGVWNTLVGAGKEVRDTWVGTLSAVKNFAVDFLLGDVVGGALRWGVKVLSFGAVAKDTSWVPFADAAGSVRNLWNKREVLLAPMRQLGDELGTCVGRGGSAEARGQACGRALAFASTAFTGVGFVSRAALAANELRTETVEAPIVSETDADSDDAEETDVPGTLSGSTDPILGTDVDVGEPLDTDRGTVDGTTADADGAGMMDTPAADDGSGDGDEDEDEDDNLLVDREDALVGGR